MPRCSALLIAIIATLSNLVGAASPSLAASPAAPACDNAAPAPPDIVRAFSGELRSPAILRFISAIATAPAFSQRLVFNEAVAAAATPAEGAIATALAATCADPERTAGAARALIYVEQTWRPRGFAEDDEIAVFDRVLRNAIGALADSGALAPDLRRTALRPFDGLFAAGDDPLFEPESAAHPARTAQCASAQTYPRAISFAKPDYALMTIDSTAATPPVTSVDIRLSLSAAGDVRSAAALDVPAAGLAETRFIETAVLTAASSAYAPATTGCHPVPSVYVLTFLFDGDGRWRVRG